jgi:IS5 family transposase
LTEQYNILYRYFVGLQTHDSTADDTTLVVFRTRCGQNRLERLFDRVVQFCKEKNLLREGLKIVDATSVDADVAIPNTVNLLRQGCGVIIKKIAKSNP